jgi:hypothetical protein
MNTSQTNSAYSTGNTQQTTPDFSHRLPEGFDITDAGHLLDQIEVMTSRSKSLLDLINSLHYEAHINQINPLQIFAAISCVKNELDDVFAVVEAFHDESLKSKA